MLVLLLVLVLLVLTPPQAGHRAPPGGRCPGPGAPQHRQAQHWGGAQR